MITFISALTISVITVLAILAYRHPSGFLKISYVLKFISAACLGIIFVWNLAVSRAYIKLLEFISSDNMNLASEALESITPPPVITLAIYLGFSIYLMILDSLHKILDIENESK
ncbi:hypothetical protein OW492_00420 [Psychromonas sp. 14N.309.X.WAT.B.A12]|uniref:hypothetical protein n=1 Tax=Psychromonas sp. 14N.309.X.WAT.B.A12 TaxID=2998322 RepID=UPI0025B1580F|nr:hypothetical protein [Psychromonas sp. 14N.309.X.WAT.B.A12]MDN2661835.1 hypothetical protein [Psychromonas sp. 14N.309.X.WAT.B.A12]